ncbi:CrcB family protein [Alicyclobacillus sp. SO9]|uniref:fluoride efflux transporter FluC n=1 Tax=Alicyclobacillus sp. SO9 TaxID=2665646 RepID=UPI0018E753A3|nr:CrcB family protein [Alicyclobacillus sp. SO9]QQE78799.1 CrcB family protein [Alicyclobacillus sp. SO9]
MSLSAEVVVGVGATAGSVLRYGIGSLTVRISQSDFPWGTWVVNVFGALLLGLIFRNLGTVSADVNWWLLLGTGFCGGFTTFSTMSAESLHLARKSKRKAFIYLGSSLLAGCFVVWVSLIL